MVGLFQGAHGGDRASHVAFHNWKLPDKRIEHGTALCKKVSLDTVLLHCLHYHVVKMLHIRYLLTYCGLFVSDSLILGFMSCPPWPDPQSHWGPKSAHPLLHGLRRCQLSFPAKRSWSKPMWTPSRGRKLSPKYENPPWKKTLGLFSKLVMFTWYILFS